MRFLLLFSALLALPSFALAQGVLVPSGAPAKTMRRLDQIDTRTRIGKVGGSTNTIIINTAGSYVLLGNIAVTSGNAITIVASGVTLDLNGFTLSSSANPAAGTGIALATAVSDITIRNGHIRGGVVQNVGTFTTGPGFSSGISGQLLSCVSVEQVSVSGVTQDGIALNAAAHSQTCVRDCSAAVCGRYGIVATRATDCLVKSCDSVALQATIATRCRSDALSTGAGISATLATNCQSSSDSGPGLKTTVAVGCVARSSSGIGIDTVLAHHCRAFSTTGPQALFVTGVASSCRGSRASGTAVGGRHAFGCTAESGTVNTTFEDLCH